MFYFSWRPVRLAQREEETPLILTWVWWLSGGSWGSLQVTIFQLEARVGCPGGWGQPTPTPSCWNWRRSSILTSTCAGLTIVKCEQSVVTSLTFQAKKDRDCSCFGSHGAASQGGWFRLFMSENVNIFEMPLNPQFAHFTGTLFVQFAYLWTDFKVAGEIFSCPMIKRPISHQTQDLL